MGVSRFEDLIVWNAARTLCREIVPLMRRASFSSDFSLRQQLNAAAISTVANIAEGFLRGGRKEFAHHLRIAAGSNGEVRAILYLAKDRRYVTEAEFSRLVESTNAIGRMLHALEKTLRADRCESCKPRAPTTRA
jgi:four helix bundle protein